MKKNPEIGTFFTARKRSLGQGNVFTPVHHFVYMEVGFKACITGHMARRVCIQRESASRGSASKGVCIQGNWEDHPASAYGGLHPDGLNTPPSVGRPGGWYCMHRWLGRPPPPSQDTEDTMRYYEIQSTSRRYASHWNAFLLVSTQGRSWTTPGK